MAGNTAEIILKRNPGQGNVKGIKLVFKNDTTSYIYEELIEIEELGIALFNIDLIGQLISPKKS